MNNTINKQNPDLPEKREISEKRFFRKRNIICFSVFLIIIFLIVIFNIPTGIAVLNPDNFNDNPKLKKYVADLKAAKYSTGVGKTILNSGIVRSEFPEINDKRVVDVLILCLNERDSFFRQFINQCKKSKLGNFSFDLNYFKRVFSVFNILKFKDTKKSLRIEAAYALGQIADKRAVKPLLEHIEKYPDSTSSTVAAYALMDIGDRRAILPIIDILEDKPENRYLRRTLVESLSFFRDPRATPVLIETLENEEELFMITHVLEGLMRIEGDEAFEAVILALKNSKGDQFSRKRIIAYLAKYGDNLKVQHLLECFKNDEIPAVRAEAAFLLGDCKTEEVYSVLLDSLKKEKDEWVLKQILVALGKHRKHGTFEILISYLDKENLQIGAILGLGELGDKRALDKLIPLFQSSKNPEIRGNIAKAFMEIRDERTVEILVNGLLVSKNYVEESRIGMALDSIGDPRAIPALERFLKRRGNVGQSIALQALGGIRDPKSVELLVECLKNNPLEFLVKQAALSLGRCRDKKAIPPLLDVLRESIWQDVRVAALDSLKKIKTKECIPDLKKILKENKDPFLRIHLLDTLYKLSKDQEYLLQLLISLKNDDLLARREILRALRILKFNKNYSSFTIKHLDDPKWHEQAYDILSIIFVNTDDYDERMKIYKELRKYEKKKGL